MAGVASTTQRAVIDAATLGNNTIVAAVTAKKIRVTSLFLVAGAANTLRFQSAAGGTALTGQMVMAANGVLALPHNANGWFETAAGALLNLELAAAATVDGALNYVEVD